jgi:murein DD-endopeptidase MepM/ murein hydrolase activator NlpD
MRLQRLLPGFGLILLFLLALSIRLPVQAAPPAQLTVFPTPTPGSDGRIVYIVQEGDTLWRISAITGVPIDEIRRLNNLIGDTVTPGQKLLIGMAGPAEQPTATAGPSPTPAPLGPTSTAGPGWGIICALLYEDKNGDGLRQEEETSLLGGRSASATGWGAFR